MPSGRPCPRNWPTTSFFQSRRRTRNFTAPLWKSWRRAWAFAFLDVDRLVSLVVPGNEASKKVARKNGMRLRGTSSLRGIPVEVYEVERDYSTT